MTLNNNILATCTSEEDYIGGAISTELKVFSTLTRKRLYKKKIKKFMSFLTDGSGSQSNLVIIQTKKIVILNFENNKVNKILKIPVNISILHSRSTIDPYISVCKVSDDDAEEEKYSMSVWKNLEVKTESILEIEDLKDFLFETSEEETEIYNGTYFTEKYLAFTISYYKNETKTVVTRIIDELGVKIRDLDLGVTEISRQDLVFYKVLL